MKLRNKKTGEIKEIPDGFICNIRQLCEEWEDYEDPKGSALDLMILTLTNFIENEPDEDKVDLEDCKQMLEKLKAWKRLQDAGVTFHAKVIDYKWYLMPKTNAESITFKEAHQIYKDIDLVFGVKDNEGNQ